jgi:FkbM family methyltransferase
MKKIIDKIEMFIWYWRATGNIETMVWITILAIIRLPRKYAPGIDRAKLLSDITTKICRKETIMRTRYGTFYGNLSMVANISSNYEKNIHRLLVENYYRNKDRKRIFINIGAHVGKYLIDLTKNYGYESYGFEPTPTTAKYLKINTILSGVEDRTKVFNFGLGHKEDVLDFYQSTVSGFNTFCPDEQILGMEKIQAPVKKFDDLDLGITEEDVSLILIDAEGFEYNVLRGMKQFLSRLVDVDIIVEIHENSRNKRYITRLMKALGYEIRPIDTANWLYRKERKERNNEIDRGYVIVGY